MKPGPGGRGNASVVIRIQDQLSERIGDLEVAVNPVLVGVLLPGRHGYGKPKTLPVG